MNTWKQTMGDDTLLPSFVGSIVGILFVILVFVCLKTRLCGGIKDCLCDICSRACNHCMDWYSELSDCLCDSCFRACNYCIDCCSELSDCKCDKCLSCICLSPCLIVNWLRGEYNERTHQNEQHQTTQNREHTSGIPVVMVQPVYTPIPQTNVNISVHHGDSRRSVTDDTFINIIHDFNEDHIETNSHASGSGWGADRVPLTALAASTAPTVDGVPPSYDEATKHDPPSYKEAHKYLANQS